MAASARSARASPTNGAPALPPSRADALTVPWYSTFGVRPAVNVLIGRLLASARAFQAAGVHVPSPHRCATLPCRHNEPSLKDWALALTTTGASSCRFRFAASSMIRLVTVAFQSSLTKLPRPD